MKINKLIKWALVLLMIVSVAVIVWGFVKGFLVDDAAAVDTLLYWAYIMVALAIAAWVVVGGIVGASNNPKSIGKVAILVVACAAICYVAYLLAPGNPAFGREGLDEIGTLKLTDTVLNLTYISGAAAIVCIIIGEIRLAITNKK